MLKRLMSRIDDSNADESIPLMSYVCQSSDGRLIPLITGGDNVSLKRMDCPHYIKKATSYRINEFFLQIQCIREGLTSVIPMPILSLLTGSRLEQLVCGCYDINVGSLKKIARYRIFSTFCFSVMKVASLGHFLKLFRRHIFYFDEQSSSSSSI